MTAKHTFLYKLVCFTAILAFCVVLMGAYTRLRDAGLGCPDWPGCYGHVIVKNIPHQTPGYSLTEQNIATHKAWFEMIHRYLAGTLAFLIIVIILKAWSIYFSEKKFLLFPKLMLMLVIFQAALGRWTVTLKLLPPVVMLHLLGGMSLTVLLTLFAVQLKNFPQKFSPKDCLRFKWWALLGLGLLFIQIMLGGWTSANYASLACTDFPYCHGELIPNLNFHQAFSVLDKIGINYQGGQLAESARITIHMTHRFGAEIVGIYWLLLCLFFLGVGRSLILFRFGILILLLLFIQISLGIINIVYLLPLANAVAHNAVATLLFVSIASLTYCFFSKHIETPINNA